ncbi:transposable element P transposase [Trichonephila clavipes]|nr:transposable element P transposase [Trichonephila clavipes]
MFSFPKEDFLRKKWIQAISRKDFAPSKFSKVCELHFSDDTIRRYTEAYNEKTGEKICGPLKRYRLHDFAVPTIFTDFPTYLSNSGNPTRECPEKRLQRLENEHLQRSIQGQHLLDPYQQPITLSPDNQKCEFLHKILSWLDSWKGKNCTTGTLTKETHLAFIHTTYALIEMSKYCINELKFQYFLPGKIQTDALESRFGKYRTLSGSQYLISIRQLYEIEAKLRMQNFLPLTLVSNTYGQLNLKDIHLEDSCNENPLE